MKSLEMQFRHIAPHALKQGIGVQTGLKADGTPAIQIVQMSFIPEGDVYRLICSSKLESAQKFESWVFDEVLPTIRKTGSYTAVQQQPIMPERKPYQPTEYEKQELAMKRANMLLDIANRYESVLPINAQIMRAYATKEISGDKFLLPLPKTVQTYSASEVAERLSSELNQRITANKIGHIANDNHLKVDEYGEWVNDKSKYSDHTCPVFRYNDKGVSKLKEFLA